MDLRIPLAPLPERAIEGFRILCNEHYQSAPMLFGPLGRALDDSELFSLRVKAEQHGVSVKVKSLPACEIDLRAMSRRTLHRILEECLVLRTTFEVTAERTDGFNRTCALAAAEWMQNIFDALKNEAVQRKSLADTANSN